MSLNSFAEAVEQICSEDPRFEKGAYHFVRQGLDHTIKNLKTKPGREGNHVSGQELLSGIREFALEQYGPLTLTVLHSWGVRSCEDFGAIVFNLVEAGVLGKTERDSRQDFADGYDFDEAFVAPFRPRRGRRVESLGGK